MASGKIGPLKRLWMQWKSLELPWRKYRLAGMDLAGTTYWEFRPAAGSGSRRMRRIAQHPRSRHYSDVSMSPAWLQWLRHTRDRAPTIDEQHQDVARQANLRHLAREADRRWAAKDSFLDRPKETPPRLEGTGAEETGKEQRPAEAGSESAEKNPWHHPRTSNPGDEWQPQAWTPGGTPKKR